MVGQEGLSLKIVPKRFIASFDWFRINLSTIFRFRNEKLRLYVSGFQPALFTQRIFTTSISWRSNLGDPCTSDGRVGLELIRPQCDHQWRGER